MAAAALRGYQLTVLTVLIGWISGTIGAGIVGLFIGLLLTGFFHSLGLSIDQAVTLTGAAVAVPVVTGVTVACGMSLLRGRPGIVRAERTVAWIAVIEIALLVPTVGVLPWLNGGQLVLGPPWAWPVGVLLVGVGARALATQLPRFPRRTR